MPCYHPLQGYFVHLANGKRKVIFSKAFQDLFERGVPTVHFEDAVTLPCGRCVGCRLERSRQWALRCVHEASLHVDNCFITLTYDPQHLPDDYSLNVKHFQDFMKRLRKRFGSGIRFFHCGEYGEKFLRPHYHAAVFNFDFSDKVLFKVVNGCNLYTSAALSELWPFGFSTVGTLTFESAAYVARYVMKKINGPSADEHYSRIHPVTGKVFKVKPEYTTMSRRPGIGRGWYDKFKSDVFPSDECVVRGKVCKPPRFYDNILSSDDPVTFELIKERRSLLAEKNAFDNTCERLMVREKVKLLQLKKLVRVLESEI